MRDAAIYASMFTMISPDIMLMSYADLRAPAPLEMFAAPHERLICRLN